MSRYTLLIILAFVTGCSGGGGTSAPTPTGNPSTTTTTASTSTSCVTDHDPIVDASGSHTVTWTKTLCGPSAPYEVVFIDENTTDDSGRVFGTTRDINRGRVTWEFTNLDYTDLKWPNNGDDIMFMGFIALHGADNEANWHILGNRFGETGPIETRLVTQRPFDDVCIPEFIRFCEKQWSDTENPYIYERAKKYKWDCYWNTTIDSGLGVDSYGAYPGLNDGRIYCDLYDITTMTQKLNTYYMPTSGPYDKLNFFVAGGDAVTYFNKAGVPMIISKFRLSIME